MARTGMANPSPETIIHRKVRIGGVDVLLKGTFSDERRGTLRQEGRIVGTFKVECTYRGDRIPHDEVKKKMSQLLKDKPELKGKKLLVSYDFNYITLDRQIICYVYLPFGTSEFDRFKDRSSL